MKKLLLIVCALFILVLTAFAQYQHITVSQLEQVPMDSLLIADTLTNFASNINPSVTQPRWTLQTSPYMNDTVTVTGLCVVPAKVITYTAGGWTMVLYDTGTVNQWGGVLVRCNAPADTLQNTADGFLNVNAGDIITMTGYVSEFPSLRGYSITQFQPIPGIPITILGTGQLPTPIVKHVSDFYSGIFPAGRIRYSTGEPFEGLLVELHNLTIDNLVNTGRGTFSAVDSAGNEISEYDWSHFFTLGHGGTLLVGPDTTWSRIYAGLGNGVRIDTIRGIISTSSGGEGPRGYRIAPLYRNDIVFGFVPPLITTHRRNPVVVPADTFANVSVRVSVQIGGSAIDSVFLYYSLNYAPFTPELMTFRSSDTTYDATIPQQSTGTNVRYFITARDVLSHWAILANSSPSGMSIDTSKGFFFYNVLNRPLTIQDVQYTPYANGRSPYLGAVTALSGIITADTAHIGLSPLSYAGTNAWYMQSSNAPWSGIWLSPIDSANQAHLEALRNGDSVTVTGTVLENFEVTQLGNITSVTKVSSGNPEPVPMLLHTGDFSVPNGSPIAEPYESMLVRFNNVIVSDTNTTFSDPTEYAVNDGSGTVVVRRDGRNDFTNVRADTMFGKTLLTLNESIPYLQGIIYYSYNAYKLVPRTNADFGVPTGVKPASSVIPKQFALDQNYPNPFNPSTTIQYSLPLASQVTLKVYNILGQEVRTLVDEVQPVGAYKLRFDGSSLASGVYFYRLQAGTFTQVKKMVMVK